MPIIALKISLMYLTIYQNKNILDTFKDILKYFKTAFFLQLNYRYIW